MAPRRPRRKRSATELAGPGPARTCGAAGSWVYLIHDFDGGVGTEAPDGEEQTETGNAVMTAPRQGSTQRSVSPIAAVCSHRPIARTHCDGNLSRASRHRWSWWWWWWWWWWTWAAVRSWREFDACPALAAPAAPARSHTPLDSPACARRLGDFSSPLSKVAVASQLSPKSSPPYSVLCLDCRPRLGSGNGRCKLAYPGSSPVIDTLISVLITLPLAAASSCFIPSPLSSLPLLLTFLIDQTSGPPAELYNQPQCFLFFLLYCWRTHSPPCRGPARLSPEETVLFGSPSMRSPPLVRTYGYAKTEST